MPTNNGRIVVSNILTGRTAKPQPVPGETLVVGSAPDCNVVLPAPAPALAFVIEKTNKGRLLTAKIDDRVSFQDETLASGNARKIGDQAEILVLPHFSIKIEFPKKRSVDLEKEIKTLDDRYVDFELRVHDKTLDRHRSDLIVISSQRKFKYEQLHATENWIDEAIDEVQIDGRNVFAKRHANLRFYIVGLCVRDLIVDNVLNNGRRQVNPFFDDKSDFSQLVSTDVRQEGLLANVADLVSEKIFGNNIAATPREKVPEILEEGFWEEWLRFFTKNPNDSRDAYAVKRYLKKKIKDTLFGYGPLEDLLRSPSVSEIMVVNPETIYVERSFTDPNSKKITSCIINSGRRFSSEEETQKVIGKIVEKAGRAINQNEPLVDARLVDGSRVNAVIPPLAVSGSCLTIRRFPEHRLTVDKLIEIKSITPSAAEFLRASVVARKNILVSGGTGTGKTTLLNCLCDYVPENERIVTIEDTAELQINKRHLVRLEARKKTQEDNKEYTIGDLVRNALRMRPDRIIVGECRGGEASDMLQAMNTGHDGSLTTIHANNTRDVILRLETLAQMGSLNIPVASIDRQIVAAVDIVVQLRRMRGGARRVSSISEIVGIDEETNEVVVRDIFALENDYDPNARLSPTGRLPSFIEFLLENNYLELERFYHDGP